MYRKLFLFIFLLSKPELVNAIPDVKNPIALACEIIQQHPFITATVIVVLLQEKPWEFIKEIITYFLKEHPILTTIIIGLLISGSYREIITCANGLGVVLQYAVHFCSWLMINAERYFREFHTNFDTYRYKKKPDVENTKYFAFPKHLTPPA